MVKVAVFGAFGHTGRFVVAELAARGFEPIEIGRQQASVEDPGSLDRALRGAAAVINCAGPFAATAGPVIAAALRAGIGYVDVAAEIEANVDTFTLFAAPAREAGVVVAPAVAFFGGLGDLLVTAVLEGSSADEILIGYGLSSWHPTAGTVASGAVSRERRGGRRVRFAGGRLEYHDDELPVVEWEFPSGPRTVIADFSMADVVTVPSHVQVPVVRCHMNVEAVADLTAGDSSAVTAQTFVVDVRVRRDGVERRITATGSDIYAVSAPLAVEAVARIVDGRTRGAGVLAAGAAFDARDFLRAMSAHLTVTVH
ncbi:saccharopine dehydrogenase NADP-binding domain-containing protein [Actinoplanes missouriensis]|uniref:saccharopine dehydrogenase NADP-binding domain-containing protein n=1 Tax=Actinoplanes missouriensis TaxID=1866 RepID=UPI0033D17FD0